MPSSATASTTILIDAVFFQLYKTGIARLWQSLLEEWAKDDFRQTIIVLDRAGTAPKIPGIYYREIPPFSYQDIEVDRELLQTICDEEAADLFISTYYTIPRSTPSIFMGYDMIPEVLGWDLNQPMWQSKHAAIKHAIGHITISQNTAQDLKHYFPQVNAAHVTPILCGVAPDFEPSSELDVQQFRSHYNLHKPYFLLVGAGFGYKNAELFLEGFAQLVSRQGFEVVCTGSSASSFSTEARKILPSTVFHPLFLSDEELRIAYSDAVALVYPSKYEGFGLPIVEAMNCGCPVITCANASIPEVGGEAVIYIDDSDVNAMSDVLLEVQKPHIRQHLIQAGHQQAAKFTWAKMAAQMKRTLSGYLAQLAESSINRANDNAEIAYYEAAIAENPDDRQLYWQYGLALLLNGQEEAAQTTWFMVLAAAETEAEQWQMELTMVLETAAIAQQELGNQTAAWLIRQHLRSLDASNLNNLLHLLLLTIANHSLDLETFAALELVEALTENPQVAIEFNLLQQALAAYLNQALIHPITVEFINALRPWMVNESAANRQMLVDLILDQAHRIGQGQRYRQLAIQLLQISLEILPNDFASLITYANFAEQQGDYQTSIQLAQQARNMAATEFDRMIATKASLQSYLSSGQHNAQLLELSEQLQLALQDLIAANPRLTPAESYPLLLTAIHLPYIADTPQSNRALQNQVSALCERSFQQQYQTIYDRYQAHHASKRTQLTDRPLTARPLKVGYLCRCFHRHSVGWLARWLLQNHQADRVESYIYIINPQTQPDSVQRQYQQMPATVRDCSMDALEIAETIYQDDLDILVELDSLTSPVTCEVLALKPAPIQVTWLGWDAVGMTAIDYFLADQYVLPASAQADYVEKIWRLPRSYIAVGGFEVGTASISRQTLGIPSDAIVYMSAQRGYKRHPQTMRQQIQILQQVPHSYLLIKGLADQTIVQAGFATLAQEFDVDPKRIIFLPIVESEETHRANLTIADIILDTFPYNGATTTLEALWMERPLVTQVGAQFAARNSYTMLKNVGVAAGIAWNAQEYVHWGVKLGLDSSLRKSVMTQLSQAKLTAPLWQPQQFARDIETAYQQMWCQFSQS